MNLKLITAGHFHNSIVWRLKILFNQIPINEQFGVKLQKTTWKGA